MKNIFSKTTEKRTQNGVKSYSFPTRLLYTISIFMLLTIGVGQMWADDNAGFYEVYMTYSYNGTSSNYTYRNSDSGNSSIDLGTLTADFQITSIYWKFWYLNNDWNRSGNVCGGLLGYNLGSGDQEWTPSLTWKDKGWDSGANNRKKECYTTTTKTIAQYNSGPSGSYTFSHWFKGWGSVSNSSDCNSQWYINNGGGNYSFTYKIAPPAVSGFGVSTSGYLAGSGTEEDPYLVKSGNSLTFTVSGSKARTDDNSTFNYWLNSGAKQTSGTLSTGSITSSDLQSAVIHGQCINNSSSSLVGTESTSTIYYKAVDVKDITVYIYVGGCTVAQINSVEMNGCTPYVGTKALAAVKINNRSAGEPKFTLSGNWLSYTFTNVTKVSSITCAREGGNIFTGEITDNVYYKFDGAKLDGKCVSAPKLTWTTAPVDAKVGVHMKAVVNTTPVSGGSPRVTWYTSNSNIAAVNESTGEISYKAAGDVTITAHVTWSASGDYCAGSYDLEQTITVIAPEITAATFVQNPILTTDHLQVSISYRHIPAEGCYIRLKQGDGYYMNEHNESYIAISEGSGNLIFTTLKTEVPSGVWTVEIWNQAKDKLLHSRDVEGSLTVKTGHTITVTAGANGAVSPSTVYAGDGISSANFTATPNTGYEFVKWTKTDGAENFTLNNESSATTFVTTASSSGTVRADFRGALHTLTLQNTGHGHIISSPEGTARTGETVTITPTPDSGYEFDYIEVNGVSQEPGVTTFTMPGADVTVTAHFKLHSPELGAVTATLSGQQNYGELPIDFALSVTSTYLPNPVVVFLVNDGETTYEVVGAPYGANGNDAAGTIGPDPIYTTVHKATFTASAAKTYTVSAKLYEGELIDNFEGENTRGWAGDNLGNGSMTFANNPVKMTVNGSNKVMQVTRTSGNEWGGAIMLFVADTPEAKTTCDAAGSNDYTYIHAHMKDATDATHLKNNDNTSDGNNGDINPSFVGATSSDWRHVTYRNTHCSNNFLFFMIQRGNTDDKTVYIDDIILSNEETMTVKATAAAPASFSINTVTLNNNDATTPGTESVIVTYGSALSNITVPSKTDYTFYGYYTENAGEGRQLINDAGEWIASVDGYTNENKKWVHDGNVTLYAYYKKAQITRITFSPGNIVAPGATVTVTATVEPEPAGETTICWRVLYSNDNPLDPQPTFTPAKAQGNSVSFIAPEASGSYKVEATLRKGTGCGGEEIHTFTAPFQVAGDHTVTVQYKCGDVTLQGSTSVSARPLDWSTEITPDEIFGYSFEKWVAGDGVTMTINGGETTINTGGETTGKDGTHAVQIKAIYDGKLIAQYTKKNIIYFKNTLGWSEVYVNLYPYAWWNSSKGAGNETLANDKRNKQMTQLGETDIWYYEYGNTATTAYVSFTDRSQNNYTGFAGTSSVNKVQVSYPTRPYATEDEDANYGFNAGTPMFVPTAGQTAQPWNKSGNDDLAEYYNKGYWRKYDPIQGETGYTLKVYNMTEDNGRTELKSIKFVESDVPGQLFKAVANLEAAGGYGIKFERDNSMLYTNISGHLQSTGDVVVTEKQDANYRAIWIKATAAGDYTFAITINGDGKLCIQAEFPVAKDDYRVIYTDNATWTKAHTAHTWIHPSRIISAEENAVDTISFFVSKGHSPEFRIQKVNTIDAGTGAIEWTDVTDWTSCDDVDASGVYNFIFTQDGSKNIRFTKKEPYTGNYYIRTDNAGTTKWDNYRAADHQITYSEYSITHGGYSHYYCHWVDKDAWGGTRKNIKFCIANDYSPCISDTLIRENNSDQAWTNINNYIDEKGNILRNANVRFMWNQSTNKVSRAYVDGTQGTGSNNFLYILSEDNKIRKMDESALDDHKVSFSDNENWIYEANIQAQPKAAIKLLSNWGTSNTITQYFKGSSNTTEYLIDGSGEKWYNIRLLYDFKTNRLVAAMVPTGNIDDPMPINADVMFIREHQGDIEQLTFTGDGAITEIKTAYAVMRFNKWTLNNKEKTGEHTPLASPASIYERSLYYVSFPFPVNLNEVFGFGTYGQHWIIQRYRGDLRAQQGFWAESAGFWEFIWNRNGVVLQPNEGYILTLETELLGEESDVWGPDHRSNQIELFFPSTGNLGTITNSTVNCTIPEHTCYINRHETEGLPETSNPSTSYNRTVFDSHWNIMSVPTYVNVDDPSFANTTWIGGEKGNVGPKFLYTWNMNDNTLTATSGKGFMYHAMHAYTVQYHGEVTWTTSVTPTAAPQRNTEYRGEYEFCLEVQQDEQMIDRTFVRLSDDENVTPGFEFSEDMTKQFNSRKANIFTIAGNTSLGGNSLPLSTTQTTVVPVGVKIKTAGDYTFSIPEGTEGIGVTLVDNETGVRTSLSALEYTVNLAAGDYTERFWLEISPIQNTPTGLEEPTSDSSLKGRAQKRIIDGVLYIVKDGKIFDARGTRVE